MMIHLICKLWAPNWKVLKTSYWNLRLSMKLLMDYGLLIFLKSDLNYQDKVIGIWNLTRLSLWTSTCLDAMDQEQLSKSEKTMMNLWKISLTYMNNIGLKLSCIVLRQDKRLKTFLSKQVPMTLFLSLLRLVIYTSL